MTVVLATSPDALDAHLPAWDELATAALEPNVFQESWMIAPGWRAFGAGEAIQALFVYSGDRLDGVFVLERVTRLYGLPMAVLRSWTHQYSPLGTPLVRAGAAAECLDALFDWLAHQPGGAPIAAFTDYGADGPFQRALASCARRRRLAWFDAQTYPRAVLRRAGGASGVVAAAVSPGRLKELRRQRRRLEEAGTVELRALQPGADANPWIRAFLDLERAGWKGRAQTALASHPAHQRFFEQIALDAHRRGRLRLLGLFVDDRPIALKCNLVAAPGSFAWKIAFDEAFARCSPGVLLELEHVATFHDEPGLAWMDSCATEDHQMIDRLWSERRAIAVTLLSTGRTTTGRLLVAALDPLRRLYRLARRARGRIPLRTPARNPDRLLARPPGGRPASARP
jgi:CelD/BcsL family acetyltransferase involved in cellulose biosynthesis